MSVGVTYAVGALARNTDSLRGSILGVTVERVRSLNFDELASGADRQRGIQIGGTLRLQDVSFIFVATRSWPDELTPRRYEKSMASPVRVALSRELKGERDGTSAELEVVTRRSGDRIAGWDYTLDDASAARVREYLQRHVRFERASTHTESA